jgi:CheY-like chemotaxis protein
VNSTKELLHQIADPRLSQNERAQLRCQLARQLEEEGNYEAAHEVMGDLWQRVGERPVVEGLDQETAADVLLRAGSLTGWLGSAKQIEGAQEIAKNLISESSRMFEAAQNRNKVAEAQTDLAVCYWRAGAFDEARVILQEALIQIDDADIELRAVALIRRGLVERAAKRLNDALRIYDESAPLFEKSTNHLIKANFHHGLANVLKDLRAAENREDYTDRALIEYAAAGFHFEEAGHARYAACVENNLGFLCSTIGRFADAHEHLDHAQLFFTSLKDDVHLAQVDETRARVMLAEGRVVEAEKTARRAVRTLEKGDEQSLLAEALTTHGISLVRLDHHEQAHSVLERAVAVAEQAGDPESAGLGALVMIEELATYLSNDDLNATVERARELLKNTQDMSTLRRLAVCACRALSLIHPSPRFPASVDWTNFSFPDAVLNYEAHFIKLALKDAGGGVTRAAHLLGFKHHQTLLNMLNGRHQSLRHGIPPITPRKRSIVPGRHGRKGSLRKSRQKKRTVRILHVEDNATVATVVKETLEAERWQVETCADGTAALEKVAGEARYDLLLLDYDLPGANGIQIAQQARELTHRRQTPIVILSATLDEAAARAAGADEFLRKPEDLSSLAETITRLLASR